MKCSITQTEQVSRRETAERRAAYSVPFLFALVMFLGVGSAWAQVDPCSKTYEVCSGSSVVLTHDASCGNGGQYAWAAFEDDCNYYFNGVRSLPTYTIGNFGGTLGGGIGAGWGDGENEDHLTATDENRCHYPGSMTVDIKNSNSADPYIYFEIPGGADPSIYKYFIIRYRVNLKPSGANLGNMEVFFYNTDNTDYTTTNNYYRVYSSPVQGSQSSKCVTNNYQHVVIDASANPNWTTGGKITGFRLDPISYSTSGNKQVHLSIDYIALVATPPAAGNASLTLNDVTENTTMKSYQINTNGTNTIPVTQQANPTAHMSNSAGVIYYGWTSTEATHEIDVRPALNAGEISTGNAARCLGDGTALSEISEEAAASHTTGATLSYKWYVAKDGGTPALIPDATSETFTPDITNYNTVTGTYVFTREVISDLCEDTPKTSDGSFTLTVKAVPTMTVSNQTFYTNDGEKTVTFTSDPAGATFAWTNSNTAIGLGASGTDNISFTPTNSTSGDLVASIAVTPTLDGCPGTEQNFTITVKNGVTMNDITDYASESCSGTELLAAFTSEIEGVSYNWSHTNTNVTPASGTVGTSGTFSQVFTNSASTAQTVTFTVTPTKDGIEGSAKTFTVTVYPLPTVSITDYPATVCPGGTTSFTGTVTTTATGNNTFHWYDEGDGFLITDYEVTQAATTHTTAATAPTPSSCNRNIDIYLTVTDGNGCSATDTKTVSVKDQTPPTIGDFTVPAATAAGECQYAIPNLEFVTLDATTDNCTNSSDIIWMGQSPDPGTTIDQGTTVQNITVTVNVKDACGNPQSKDVTVTIPAKNVNVTINPSATSICLGESSTFSATEGYSLYSWEAANASAGLPATTNMSSITVTPTAAGEMSYSVTVAGDNGCKNTATAALTVKTLPTISADPATQYATYGSAITPVQITVSTGATVTTTTLPDGLSYASSAISGTPTAVGNYTVTATATLENCTASTPITINVGKKPLTITYTGADFVYDGQPVTVNYSDLTYTGLVSGDAINAGTITTDGYKVGDYYCTAGSFSRMWADYTATATGFGPADIAAKYEPTFDVKITIKQRPLEITANSNTKEYDATPLTDAGYTFTNGTSLASTDEATVTVTGSQLTPGSSDNVVGEVSIKHNGDNEDVTDCYAIAKVNGLLTVNPPACPTTVEYEGYTYPVVRIGAQCWFAENLRAEIGDAVPFDENSENTPKFGLLYNWTDALNGHGTKETDPILGDYVQGTCPEGWALPSAEDFEQLKTYVHDMADIRSDNPLYWLTQYLGNNSTGFDERGGGLYNSATSRFEELKSAAYFWTSESVLNPDAYAAGTALAYVDEYYCSSDFIKKVLPQNSKLSVRCISKTVPTTDFNLEVSGPEEITLCASSTTPVTATYQAVLDPAISTATYQWYVNDSPVSGEQSATFVKSYTSADAGTAVIKCEATADGTTKDGSVSTQVLVLGPYSAEHTLEICDCQLPYTYSMTVGTDTWTETWTTDNIVTTPTRSHTFVTANGCDSVVSITLKTWSAANETSTTCPGVTTYNSNETGNGSGLETVTDYDGNVYHVVQIGNQCWMKENLRVTHFANGTALTGVSTVDEGNRADIYYTTTRAIQSLGPCDATITMEEHTQRYGLLYNWYTAMGTNTPTDNMHNVQGICPDGWHLPDTTEWHTLEAAIGITGVHSGSAFLGTTAIQIVTGCEWHESEVSGSVGDYTSLDRNATGFSARPAGCFFDNNVTETVLGTTWHKDDIAYAGVWCFFWSSTKYNKPDFAGKAAYNYDLHFDQTGISRDQNGADYLIGRSVRCIRNS